MKTFLFQKSDTNEDLEENELTEKDYKHRILKLEKLLQVFLFCELILT